MLAFILQLGDNVVDNADLVVDPFIDELEVEGRVDREESRSSQTTFHNYYSSI